MSWKSEPGKTHLASRPCAACDCGGSQYQTVRNSDSFRIHFSAQVILLIRRSRFTGGVERNDVPCQWALWFDSHTPETHPSQWMVWLSRSHSPGLTKQLNILIHYFDLYPLRGLRNINLQWSFVGTKEKSKERVSRGNERGRKSICGRDGRYLTPIFQGAPWCRSQLTLIQRRI